MSLSRMCSWLAVVSLVEGAALALLAAQASLVRREGVALAALTALLVLLISAIVGTLLLGLARLAARRGAPSPSRE